MPVRHHSTLRAARQRGLSLVELMVGLVVGLVVSLVIYMVLSGNESLRRSTSAGADAQQGGMLSLSILSRDVLAAGYGMPGADTMVCARYFTYFDDGGANGPVPDFPGVAPVRITDGGTAPGASDRLTVLWGTSIRANVADGLLQNVTAVPNGTAAKLQPASKVGLSGVGGFVWLTDDKNDCALMRITASEPSVLSPDTVVLSHDPATGTAAAPNYNPPDGAMGDLAWPSDFSSNPRIHDVGALLQRTYSVANGSLVATDYFTSSRQVDVASNVVAMKAQYGISDAGSQVVNQWVSATLGPSGNWALPTTTDQRRIKAVRLAIVVRSALKERPDPTTGACSVTSVPPISWPDGPDIDLSNDPDWRCYRYRSFDAVMPLRNVLWANLQ
ncbi:PilW family protein [Variovorax dokdonensis]|uniref:PilW family protein n=1 Tax=Variovorax dokdonensis TaxID=344883 RepID=A0ABT7N9M3_9BURK|nr:PilW family protein [Variovorax dokdonensis]MDM0044638.1 PilW family protein [Variovorax dokdonensis]